MKELFHWLCTAWGLLIAIVAAASVFVCLGCIAVIFSSGQHWRALILLFSFILGLWFAIKWVFKTD